MSRLGVRRRLREWLEGPSEEPRYTVGFVLPDGAEREAEALARYTLVMASQALETPIATGCPDGTCGGCVVDLLSAEGLAPALPAEVAAFRTAQQRGPTAEERLACHARVAGPGARVRVRKVWTLEDQRGV